MVYSEISLLVAILSIAVNLQQYRAILSIALHCVTEVVYCENLQEIHMQSQCFICMTCQWNHHRLILGNVSQLDSDIQLLVIPSG